MSELVPAFRQQFFDNNGLPLAGGKVFSYAAGTTTPLATYTDESGNTPNANPIILDASGTASIWMGNSNYKFILEDSLGNIIETVDEVLSTAGKIAAAVNVAGALDILNNLSDVNNAQTSLNNLVGTQSSGKYLRSDGTNVSLNTIQAGDLPSITLAGDVSGTPGANTVNKINGVSLGGLSTGILKNTTTTGVPSIAVAGDFPTLNQNTSGTALNITATSNSTLTTLSSLSLPGSQVTGTVPAATTASTVTTNANLTGPVTSVGNATSVTNNAITNAMRAQMATLTIKGNNTGGTANEADLTVAQVNTMLGGLSNPMTTAGDIIYGGASGTPTRLPTGTGALTGGSTPSYTAFNTSPTASNIAQWDANKNLSANNFIEGFTTTATAAGTTTMTIASTYAQYWTGSTTQTVKLPTTSVAAGQAYLIENRSTGVVTVQSSGANTIQAMVSNTQLLVTALVATPTTAANWDSVYSAITTVPVALGGTGQTTNITAPTATTIPSWDANKNLSANALVPGFTTTATAAGTTTMTIASTQLQYWTGVTTQTVKLPTTSVVAGGQYYIQNLSSGVVTVQSSGANTIVTLSQNTGALFTALVATPTTAANWDFEVTPSIVGSSSGNVLTSTGATSAPTWQATAAAATGLVVAAHVPAWTGGSPSGEWSTSTGSTMGAFTSNANAPVNTLDFTTSTFGTPQTANSNLPQITVNSLAIGTYKVTAQFMCDLTSGVQQVQTYALNDGTTTSGNQSLLNASAASEPSITLIGFFKYAASANRTFSVWGQSTVGNPVIYMFTNTGQTPQLNWIIEKVT